MAFKSRTSSLLYAADHWKSGSLIGSFLRQGRDVIEGVVSWGGRQGAAVKSLKWRIGGAKAEIFAPVARSNAQVVSIACRTQKPSIVVKNLFNGFFLRSHPESLVSKYATKITPQPYWSFFRSPEQFRSLGRKFAMYSFVGLGFAANCQGPELMSREFDEVCHDIRKMFGDRLVYGASCTSVERMEMEHTKLDDYQIGQLVMTNGHTACFEAKSKSSSPYQLTSSTTDELCSFEVVTADEYNVIVAFEEDSVVPSESGVNQAVEIISSQQKELQEICEVVCGQNKKLANLVNQVFISTDDHSYDSDSDSSIEVIGQWQESQVDHCDEKGIDGYSYDYDSDDDNDSIVGLDVARQLDQVTELALKRRMEVSELLAAVLEQNRRLKALASSYEPVNDFDLIIKVRWMTDCSLEYAAGVLISELLPAHESYSVDQDWSRSTRRVPSHFNVAPVIGGFLTTIQELKTLSACHDALPCVSSWQQDIAVCIVTKRYELTLAEFLASHEPGTTEATLMLLQLVEAVVHMGNHQICHRDLKSDSIFIEHLADGPRLLIANFGSSLHIKTKYRFLVACDADDFRRCSWNYLMAPEYFAASSPLHQDFTKADLWTCGALAYEVFGAANPFRLGCNGKRLTSTTYLECDLPDISGSAPSYINRLVKLMLKRDPQMRPDPELIANTLHLSLWAPRHWKQSLPSRLEVKRWITQFAAETYMLSSPHNVQRPNDKQFGEFSVMNALKVQFLSRANTSSVTEAADLLYDISTCSN